MSEKSNNNLRHTVLWLTAVSLILGLFVFLDGRIDNKVKSHPSVIQLEKGAENTDKNLASLDTRLQRIEEKLDKLLEQQKRR